METYNVTRQHSPFYAYTSNSTWGQGIGNQTFHTTSGRGNDGVYTSSISGFKNPRWKSQVKQHINATTAMTATSYKADRPWFNIHYVAAYKQAGKPFWEDTECFGYPYLETPGAPTPPSTSDKATATNRCIRKFIDEWRSAQSSIEGGQDLGEIKQTLESLHHPLKSMRDSIATYVSKLRKFKHLYRGQPVSLRKALADTYLEFHFGVGPLGEDIAGVISDVQKLRPQTLTIQASSRVHYSGSNTRRDFSTPGYVLFPIYQNVKSSSSYSIRYRGSVLTRAVDNKISLAQSLRLTPRDWAPTAWDLLPWSWMADYFINIGDIINALSIRNSDLVWGVITEHTETSFEFSDVFLGAFPPNGQQGSSTGPVTISSLTASGGSTVRRVRNVTRSSLGAGGLVPSVQFTIPVRPYPFYNAAAIYFSKAKRLVPFF
jgi:hypothetical protein